MKRRTRGAVCLLLILCMVAAMSVPVQAATSLPDSVYLSQEGYSTCTLCATAMMLRARMYLGGNSQWSTITESGIRSTAWIEGTGLRWAFTYKLNGHSASVSYASSGGMSAETLKGILDLHPEGIVLYCGKLPHAVFATDYEGDTFYCAEPVSSYGKGRIKLADSYLGDMYGSQENVLANVTAYWYVSSYSGSGTGSTQTECTCSASYAGEYVCTAADSMNIRGGHGTGYAKVGSIPGGAVVTVTKASGTGSGDWAHVTYNGVSGYVSMQYLSKKGTVQTALEITKQPQDASGSLGERITLTVGATGDGLTYQWQYSTTGTGGWSNSSESGNKTATLSVLAAEDCDGLRYRCVITDRYGNTVTSGSATVSVKTQSQDCGCSGAYAGEYVCTAGDSMNIRGGHGTSYAKVGSIPAGAVVTVTRASGTGSGDWAHVTYNGVSGYVSMQYLSKRGTAQTALEITRQPRAASGALGERITLTVGATGDGLTYQWQYSTTGTGDWRNSSESGNKTATLSILAAVDCDGLRYRCVVTDAHGTVRYSDAAVVTVTFEKYTVSYNANGGRGAPAAQTKIQGTALRLSTTEPTRAGYRFVGWAGSRYASTAAYQAGGSYTGDADITLYAVWEEEIPEGWVQDDDAWYYYTEGVKSTGWLQDGESWYYLDDTGAMVTGAYTIHGVTFTFGADGVWEGFRIIDAEVWPGYGRQTGDPVRDISCYLKGLSGAARIQETVRETAAQILKLLPENSL